MSHPLDETGSAAGGSGEPRAESTRAAAAAATAPARVAGNLVYLDPWTGVSGNMLLAALLDLDRESGRLEAELRRAVEALGLSGATLKIVRDVERGVSCTRVNVNEDRVQPLRGLADMEKLLQGAAVAPSARHRALEAIRRLAEVEAAIHDCAPTEIHFHEVGAVDTLVDVLGTFVLVEALGITRVGVGPIPVGGGNVEIAHGRVGVPAPATLRLLKGYPIHGGPERHELTTPTGALLVRELRAEPGPVPRMKVQGVGYGAGSMKLDCGPNVLRVLLGTLDGPPAEATTTGDSTEAGESADTVVLLESNVDDVSPEVIGHACRALREAGALDVWTVPAGMKKERPATVLHVLASPVDEQNLVEIIFAETGTLGVRRQFVSRWLAERGVVRVPVAGGEVGVKWGRWQGRLVGVAAEYEEAAALSATTGLPVKDIMRLATKEAWDLLAPGPA